MFAIHHSRLADSFPPVPLWHLTQLCQGNLPSKNSAVPTLFSAPAEGLHRVTHLESILAKVYQNKQLQRSLESTLMKNMGGWGVLWLTNWQLRVVPKECSWGAHQSPATRPSHCSRRP